MNELLDWVLRMSKDVWTMSPGYSETDPSKSGTTFSVTISADMWSEMFELLEKYDEDPEWVQGYNEVRHLGAVSVSGMSQGWHTRNV